MKMVFRKRLDALHELVSFNLQKKRSLKFFEQVMCKRVRLVGRYMLLFYSRGNSLIKFAFMSSIIVLFSTYKREYNGFKKK